MKKILLKSIQKPSWQTEEQIKVLTDLTSYRKSLEKTQLECKFQYFLDHYQETLLSLYNKWIIPYCKKNSVNIPSYEHFCEFCFNFTD
jgi:hypothetical protein